MLSGSNASVGQSNAVIAGGQFTSLLANRAVTRRAQPQTTTSTATSRRSSPAARRGRGVRSRQHQLERLGQRLRRRAVAQYRSRHGRAGGAAVDRRRRVRRRLSRRAADGAGRGAGLERQQLFGGVDRRQRPRHRLPCRPLWHARLERLLRQRRAGLQPLRRQHARARSRASARPRRPSRRQSPASSPPAWKSAGRSSSANRPARGSPSRRSRPSSRYSCGRRPSPNSSVTATGQPGVFALNYQAQNTTSLPTFLGAQFDVGTQLDGRPFSAWLRAAWVHEFNTYRGVTAGFAVLPGTSFSRRRRQGRERRGALRSRREVRRRQPDVAVPEWQHRAVVARPEHRRHGGAAHHVLTKNGREQGSPR